MLDEAGLRKATAAATVCLGLVRRANRDGHSMRTFEVPAMNGCLLAERTADHLELFGADGDAVRYFEGPDDAVQQVVALLADNGMRDRLVTRARELVVSGRHTYADRLASMLTMSERRDG
jgi:spore maturation protein CgeB